MAKAAFDDAKKTAFKQSIANAAGVSLLKVSITNIASITTNRRRLLAEGIEIDVEVAAQNSNDAEAVANKLTADNINAELAEAGLPEAQILSPPRTTDGSDDSCTYSNDGTCDEPDICTSGTDSTDCSGTSGSSSTACIDCTAATTHSCYRAGTGATCPDLPRGHQGGCQNSKGIPNSVCDGNGKCVYPASCLDSGAGDDSCEFANNFECDEGCPSQMRCNPKCEANTDTSDCSADPGVLQNMNTMAMCTSEEEGEQAIELCFCEQTWGNMAILLMIVLFMNLGGIYVCCKSRCCKVRHSLPPPPPMPMPSSSAELPNALNMSALPSSTTIAAKNFGRDEMTNVAMTEIVISNDQAQSPPGAMTQTEPFSRQLQEAKQLQEAESSAAASEDYESAQYFRRQYDEKMSEIEREKTRQDASKQLAQRLEQAPPPPAPLAGQLQQKRASEPAQPIVVADLGSVANAPRISMPAGNSQQKEAGQTTSQTVRINPLSPARRIAWKKLKAAKGFAVALGQRLLLIIPSVLSGDQNVFLWLYVLDLVLLAYFGSRQQYCPGCLYNDLHTFRTGKVLPAKFASKSGRFSGSKKWIVGIAAISALVNTAKAISVTACYFYSIFLSVAKSPDEESFITKTDHYKTQPIMHLVQHGIAALGILMNFRTSMVAAVTCAVFYPTVIVSVILVAQTPCLNQEVREKKKELKEQEEILRRGDDQRAKCCCGLCCGCGYLCISKHGFNVWMHQFASNNLRRIENNTRKICGIFYYPDLGSYAGTREYEFWVLVWVRYLKFVHTSCPVLPRLSLCMYAQEG